jgi:hypothetical protein
MRHSILVIVLFALGLTFASLSAVVYLSSATYGWLASLSASTRSTLGMVLPAFAGIFLGAAALVRSRRSN